MLTIDFFCTSAGRWLKFGAAAPADAQSSRSRTSGIVALALAALTAATLLGCTSGSETAARKAAEAARLLEAGRPREAQIAAVDAVVARDDVPDYWRLLGRTRLQGGNFTGAYEAYRRANELDPADPESLQILADVALRAGRTSDAVKAADQLLLLQPTLTRPRLVKGMAALMEGDEKTAETLANEILMADPGDEVGKVLKARVLASRMAFAEAVAVLDNVSTARSEIVLATLVELFRALGNGERLAATLREIHATAPNDDRLFDLVATLLKLGRRDAARTALLDGLQNGTATVTLHDRAYDFLTEYDPNFFDGAPASLSSEPRAALRILGARLLLHRARARQAQEVLEPLIGAETSPDVWALYATAIDGMRRPGASRLVAWVLRIDETNAYALALRATLSRRRGDFEAALHDAQLVAREYPDSVDARLGVIRVHEASGRRSRARQLYEELLQRKPASLVAVRAYIDHLQRTGDADRASQVIRTYTFNHPDRIDGWRLRKQLCSNDRCARESATGWNRAAANFAPPVGSSQTGSGVLGRLWGRK